MAAGVDRTSTKRSATKAVELGDELFLDTIVALQNANDADEDAIKVINRAVGWHKLFQL